MIRFPGASPLAVVSAATLFVIAACSDSNGPDNGGAVASVAVTPPSLTLTLSETGSFTAVLSGESGAILSGRTVTWTSSNISIASVDGGVVTAHTAGTAIISATSEGKSRTASVSVTTSIAQASFAMIAPGDTHTCALNAAGKAYCWGVNSFGTLGLTLAGGIYFVPQPVSGNLTFSSITSGRHHSCALTAAGVAYCWGWNLQGQLGDGTSTDRNTPTPVSTSLLFTSISAGGAGTGEHSCALTAAGAAYCWGYNGFGQLGDNTLINRSVPVAVQGGLAFTSLSTGTVFSCGLSAQKAYCWGEAEEIGEGTVNDRPLPTAVAGNRAFKSLFASWWSACGIDLTDTAWCWGYVSSTSPTTQPTLVPSLAFGSMAPGNQFTCGTTLTGAGHCWGLNNHGQLGDGTSTTRGTPTPVIGSITFAKIVAGSGHNCGLTASGLAYCWGVNSSGQLGDGTQLGRLSPTPVRSPQ